jgi:predicted 3-demethylubiquinone-9 3-methyltransferase (glyoxalase superfamily)
MSASFLPASLHQFRYYKGLAEKTFDQLQPEQFFWQSHADGNSIAIIVQHMWGNMLSRWTDFLHSDGEKSTRNRDAEFEVVITDVPTLLAHWKAGWDCVFQALESLQESDLEKSISIRNQKLTVTEAVTRQIAHYAYHVGQIVYIGKMMVQENWQSLSIPKGQSQAYIHTMMESPYTCLWFNHNAGEAARWYASIFPDTRIIEESPLFVTLELMGTKLLLLNGGPQYKPNAAQSLFAYFGSGEKAEALYKALSKNGQVLMPFGKYDWAEHYAWVADPYGIHWQLDGDDIRHPKKIVTSALFSDEKKGDIQAMLDYYASIFREFKVLMTMPAPPPMGLPPGALLFAQYKIGDTVFNAMATHHPNQDQFNFAYSQILHCTTPVSRTYFWDALSKEGKVSEGGWLQDKFGLAWQILPLANE